jgi:hypothetical protein
MYDLIGDIHGHATELKQLLTKLGYRPEEGRYRHPERRVIFLGDFIDRGPEIREVLELVRPIIDSGEAKAVMGNHEFNALAYHTEDPKAPGKHLRRQEGKNNHQHQDTLDQLDESIEDAVDWFRTLPMWLELEDEKGNPLRIAHASWDDSQLRVISDCLEQYVGVTTGFLAEASREGSPLYQAVECILKGPELHLPPGQDETIDPDGTSRSMFRTQWYRSPQRDETCGSYTLPATSNPEPLTAEMIQQGQRVCQPYAPDNPPVFVGHYWLEGEPVLLSTNVACVDYSVARGGPLCAYRWNGEQKLSAENFVSTDAIN